jgi:hypothetical protein
MAWQVRQMEETSGWPDVGDAEGRVALMVAMRALVLAVESASGGGTESRVFSQWD